MRKEIAIVIVALLLAVIAGAVETILSAQCPISFNSDQEVKDIAKKAVISFLKGPDTSGLTAKETKDLVDFYKLKKMTPSFWGTWCNLKGDASGALVIAIAAKVDPSIIVSESQCEPPKCEDPFGSGACILDSRCIGHLRCDNGAISIDCGCLRNDCQESKGCTEQIKQEYCMPSETA